MPAGTRLSSGMRSVVGTMSVWVVGLLILMLGGSVWVANSLVYLPRVLGRLRSMSLQRFARAEPQSVGRGDPEAEGASTAEEIWEFWQRRRQSLSVLRNVLSDDRNANVSKQFNDFNAYSIVEKEHVKHLNELFMAAMGEASAETMSFLWLDSPDTMCAIEADESVYSGYENITSMWNENFSIQKQQQVQLEMEQGKTYSVQVEQLDEPTLQFFGDTVMVQTDIRLTCIVEELEALSGVQKLLTNDKSSSGRKGRKRRNKSGSPIQLHITNVFERPPQSDRYFLSTHISSRDGTAKSAKRLSKETYLDTSARSSSRAKRGMGGGGVSLQQLLSGGMMGGDSRGISISSEDLDNSDDEDDEDEDEDDYDDEDYIDYDDDQEEGDDDDDSGSIQLSVSAADASEARGLVNSIADAAGGKIKVIVKDEFSDNFFGSDEDEDDEQGDDNVEDGDEEEDEDDDVLLSGTLTDDTPSLSSVFSSEIIKSAAGKKKAGNSANIDDAEMARQRDRRELVKELGASSPQYDIGSMGGGVEGMGTGSGNGGAQDKEKASSSDNDDLDDGAARSEGTIREEISSRTLQAIRHLHAVGRLTSDQKRVITTDLLKKSVTADLSKAEIAYSLIMEHANPDTISRLSLGPRPDLYKLSGSRCEDLADLEEMLVTIYNEWGPE